MAQTLKRNKKRKLRRLIPVFLCVAAVFALLWAAASELETRSRSAVIRQAQQEPEIPNSDVQEPPFAQTPQPSEAPARNTYDPALFYEEKGFYRYADSAHSRVGIDVSAHQQEIDWEQVRSAGVDFAIIRLGYRGYTEGEIWEDATFSQNMDGADGAGLDVGVYFFSQAVTPEEAAEEAAFCLQALQGRELQYPVLYDWEDIEAEARTDGMDSLTLTACARAFCQAIEEGGYRAGVYFNQTFGYQELDLRELDEYCFWLADYNETPGFAYDFEIWQYRCDGMIPGIDTEVDLDLAFVKQPQEQTEE